MGRDPGVLKARFGSHEVINTIMLNFIAIALVSYFTQYHYGMPGDPIMQTAPISAQAHIWRFGDVIPGLPARIPLNVAFRAGAAACALVYVFLWRTKWGYEIRATGSNPSAAEYGGISVRKQIVLAMAISGGWPAWSASTRSSATVTATTTGSRTTTASPVSPWRCSGGTIPSASSSRRCCLRC